MIKQGLRPKQMIKDWNEKMKAKVIITTIACYMLQVHM